MQKVAPVAITWQKLSAIAKQKVILHQSDGYCKAGQMLAIMGPSGAGKTTLLSLISQRSNQGLKVTGEIKANGSSYNSKSFYHFGTFVYQNDLLMQTLTVRQTLQFSAFLKIQDKQEAKRVVQHLLAQFQLQKCQNTYVGGLFLKGISGGQKKRLCIAIEMVAKPSVIILDEPTSGLDSNKAARVLSILKKFANNGHTIIFTIHQPSYLQYIKLDRLVLLNQGDVIYQGTARKVYDYMQDLGIKINNSSSISDFFIMQISEYKRTTQKYITPFNHQNYTLKLLPEIERQITQINQAGGDIEHIPFYIETFLFMFKMLSVRNFRCYWRNFMRFGTNLITACLRIIFVGILFLNWIPQRTVIDQQPYLWFPKILGLTFLSAAASFLAPMFQVSLSIPIQRQLYYKQVDSKKYNPFPYFISKVLIELISALVGTSLYTFAGYWFNGYNTSFTNFLGFYVVLVLMTTSGNSVGFFCGALFRQVNRVSALTPIVMIPLLVVSGIFNNLNDIPNYISWLQYLSPFRYGSQMLMQNEFGNQKFFHGLYDYKAELAINCTFGQNIFIVFGLTLGFYISSYLLLLKFTKSIVS